MQHMVWKPKNKGPRPPKTKRDCYTCKKKTTFQYDPVIGHSRCKECGLANLNSEKIFGHKKVITRCTNCNNEKVFGGFGFENNHKAKLPFMKCKKCGTIGKIIVVS
jgi:hypothetical protein